MITQLRISRFKAIASATIPLGPITVLVGPNDSGKSTILQALMALSRASDPGRLRPEALLESLPLVVATRGDSDASIELSASGEATGSEKNASAAYEYALKIPAQGNVFASEQASWRRQPLLQVTAGGPRILRGTPSATPRTGANTQLSELCHDPQRNAEHDDAFQRIASDLQAALLHLDARAIAKPAPLGADVRPDGLGLVGLVDELLTSGVGDEQIARVNDVLRRLSPHVKSVATRLHKPSGGKELHFALHTGEVIPASQMSDGLVVGTALAVTALRADHRRLLIEEPENGLHPRQLKVVADTIRSIVASQGTQVVLTTHSPLLLNHFTAEEVLVVTRDSAGVHIQPMSEAPGLDALAAEMSLGELWYNVGDQRLARRA